MYARFLSSILIILIINTTGFADNKIVKIATLGDYAPFCMTADTFDNDQIIPPGNDAVGFRGYSWDIVRESFHEMGYTIHLSITPWARAMQNIKHQRTDILFPTGKNTARQKIFNYSEEPVNNAIFLIYVLADSPIQWNGLESLKGLTIGVKREFNYGDKWQAATGLEKHTVGTISQGFQMLAAKRLDGFLGYEYNWDYVLKQEKLTTQYRKLPAFDSSAEYLVALKTNINGQGLLKDFDTGKRRLTESGKLADIKKKWFGN